MSNPNPVRSVFDDLGFSPAESAVMKLRAQVMTQLRHFIVESKKTQAEAAVLFGVSQPRVSDLVRGRLSLFSIDMLLQMAIRAGLDAAVAVAHHHAPAPKDEEATMRCEGPWNGWSSQVSWEMKLCGARRQATDTQLSQAA